MDSKFGVMILVFSCMLAVGLASSRIPAGLKPHKPITVGGNQTWRFGFNYTNWASQNSPFHIKDTLVFKYDPPNSTTFPHNVYLLRNYESFLNCNLTRAKLVANETQGGGDGFKFVLKKRQPYYFACGERAGLHCNLGMMKFYVLPMPPC